MKSDHSNNLDNIFSQGVFVETGMLEGKIFLSGNAHCRGCIEVCYFKRAAKFFERRTNYQGFGQKRRAIGEQFSPVKLLCTFSKQVKLNVWQLRTDEHS